MGVLKQLLKRKTAAFGLVMLTIIVLMALLAPLIARKGPNAYFPKERMLPPSKANWFGTDQMGRDMFARVLHGGRLSMTVSLVAVAIATLGGTVIGLVAGFAGGKIDSIIMRIIDIMLALPGILFALFIVAILGTGLDKVMIAVGISGIPGTARVVRGVTLSIRELDYIEAAKALGVKTSRLLFVHILPNAAPSILVLVTMGVGSTILSTAGMSYLGLGAAPPAAEWGTLLMGARDYLSYAWWLSFFPGLFIMITVLSINLVGDALRDILDPKLR